MSGIKEWVLTIEEVESFSGTESEFSTAFVRVLEREGNFRKIEAEKRIVTKDRSIRPDIFAEKKIGEKWFPILIECKATAPMTEARVRQTLSQILSYKGIFPDAMLGVAFPSQLSERLEFEFRSAEIEVFDSKEIAKMLVLQERKTSQAIHFWKSEPSADALEKEKLDKLFSELEQIVPGREQWPEYESVVGRILASIFSPPLNNPIKQSSDLTRSNRRDYIFPNYASTGVWADLKRDYRAEHVVADAKNSEKISKADVLQICNYLKEAGVGLFALIICRAGTGIGAGHAIREQWLMYRKMVVVLSDKELGQMLQTKKNGGAPEELIRQKIEDFRLTI